MLIQSDHVDINTPTGIMRTYIHRPKSDSKFPVVLFYSEIFQQTGPIERAAKIMASHGYAVLVPEVFHELNPIGTILAYDDAGREKGNADKEEKNIEDYDTDNEAMIQWIKKQDWCNGNIGAMGFCIGGHLAFRAALQKEVKSTACFYATDLHTNTIPNKPGQHSMEKLGDIHGELLMIWGKQDNHVPIDARNEIHKKLEATNILFSWHEFNAQHAFMRDEGDRYDAELASICYQMSLRMFSRTLY
ncbi:carboxymethylenebutenolidase family protein [Methylophilales bacterium HTCC2181]|jgi:carboxymethylenebutenolidase|uniref:Carboxymethylenebutenolidase family protein n=1 Tax=Methylophilales bacterium HTCC2181 TaxID=383631 RepID=A0P554_9PROT|nr:carboxymethylenebutenolidase family protein [Methylophilales bacterium HTCC2181]MBT5410653.1 dienelactone hydrolase family protein [Nitrosomonadales bacterium]